MSLGPFQSGPPANWLELLRCRPMPLTLERLVLPSYAITMDGAVTEEAPEGM